MLTLCFPLSLYSNPPSLLPPFILRLHHMILGDWQPPQRVRAGTDGIWMVQSCMKKVPGWRKPCKGTLNCKLSMTKSHTPHPPPIHTPTSIPHWFANTSTTHLFFNKKGEVGLLRDNGNCLHAKYQISLSFILKQYNFYNSKMYLDLHIELSFSSKNSFLHSKATYCSWYIAVCCCIQHAVIVI